MEEAHRQDQGKGLPSMPQSVHQLGGGRGGVLEVPRLDHWSSGDQPHPEAV